MSRKKGLLATRLPCLVLGVVVLGTAGVEGSDLRAGAATRVVNPTRPIAPSGHGSRIRVPPAEIYSDMVTQALVIEDANGKRFVLISCDMMLITRQTADQIRAMVKERYGIEPQAVCVHAVHNHACPSLVEREAPTKELLDPAYAEFFLNQTIAAVGEAIRNLAPARLRYIEDVCTSVAINRRGKGPNGEMLGISPNNTGAVDFTVRVVSIDSPADGKPRIILAEYAAHPVVTAVKYLGGEYPSALRKWVLGKHPGATVVFVQGCAGNIRIQILDKDRSGWVEGTPEMADRFGHDLADAVERALVKPGEPIVGPIETACVEAAAPLKRDQEPKTHPVRIQAIRLGAGSAKPFALVGLGAEAFIEYGLQIEARLRPANSMIIGYANDCAAYLPTAQGCREGGYEPSDYGGIYGLPGPYAPEAEAVVLDAAMKLARMPAVESSR